MANTPKSKDPADAALSAVEQALRNDYTAPSIDPNTDRVAPASGPRDRRLEAPRQGESPRGAPNGRRDAPRKAEAPPAAPGPRQQSARPDAPRANDEPSPRQRRAERRNRVAANDDRRVSGASLPSRRPSRLIYPAAFALSLAWVGVVGFFLASSGINPLADQSPLGVSQFANLALALVLPIGIVWGIAVMLVRAQEMRIAARSISEVASRLAEPEQAATESVVTVSQAIRREVAAMGDGIERALARASELELLVHNEVAALERSYSDNEVRMRGLIDDLANQREAIVINSERVRTSIVSAQESLSKDLREASEQIAENVIESGSRITLALSDRGEQITVALGAAGDSMIDKLSGRG